MIYFISASIILNLFLVIFFNNLSNALRIFDVPDNYLLMPSNANHNKNNGVCIFLWGNIKFVLQER